MGWSALTEQLDEVLRDCCREVGVTGAGVSMIDGNGAREPVHGTDALASAIERLQFTLGEGPCVEACAGGSPVLVRDVCDDADPATGGWPVFRAEAAQAGVRAIFAFPVRVGAVSLGAVDMYRATPGPLSDDQVATAVSTVDRVAVSLLNVPTGDGAQDPAFVSNVLIHQAAGMVMGQLDSSIEEAQVRLRATAYAEGRNLNDLAADIVHRRRAIARGPSTEEP